MTLKTSVTIKMNPQSKNNQSLEIINLSNSRLSSIVSTTTSPSETYYMESQKVSAISKKGIKVLSNQPIQLDNSKELT